MALWMVVVHHVQVHVLVHTWFSTQFQRYTHVDTCTVLIGGFTYTGGKDTDSIGNVLE